MNTSTDLTITNINDRTWLTRNVLFLIPLLCACVGLAPTVRAVTPAADGGYAGFNTAEGTNALFSLTSGMDNSALGYQALYHNTTGHSNTAEGFRALFRNTIGNNNTANGVDALYTNTTGNLNTATGVQALFRNATGIRNTATGVQALFNNTTDINNRAGSNNTANGVSALYTNTTGSYNTATGLQALYSNTTGNQNTANGVNALESNTSGDGNTASGASALRFNTLGNSNTAFGNEACSNVTTASNVTCIGAFVAGENVPNSCFIGNIRDVQTALPDAIPVVIDSVGQLGTMSSSRRFKNEIKPMDKASEAILALKPVTFHYKTEKAGTPQFGLIAEEVAQVNPDLVVRDKTGEIYTVRYDAVNVMLLNEFLKEYRKVEEEDASITQLKSTVTKQEATIAQQRKDFEAQTAQQQKEIQALTASLTEQAAQIQKVSAQLEASKPAPQVVVNNQ